MARIALGAVIVLLALCAGPGTAAPAATTPGVLALQNPGFESDYLAWEGEPDRMIAPGWSLWYTTTPAWRDKLHWDWLRKPKAQDVSACHEGTKAQQLYNEPWSAFDACLYQQVTGLTPGDLIQFTAWAKVVSESVVGDVGTRVGIDPNGGTDPAAIRHDLYPAYWAPYTADESWQELSVTVRAASETVTLYACAHPQWPSQSLFSVYWDEASYSTTKLAYVYLPLVIRGPAVSTLGTLQNPDLEVDWGSLEGYQPYPGYEDTIRTAPYWLPFWNDDYNPVTGENKQPEYGCPRDAPHRVRTGEAAQQYGLSGWGGFEAGIYQVITGTIPGATYKFEMWGLGWSSTVSCPEDYSNVREGLNFRVGVDPTGGESYTSADIVWSEPYDPYDAWHRFSVTVTVPITSDGRISVWAYAHPAAYWIRFNQVFWDTGSLRLVSAP